MVQTFLPPPLDPSFTSSPSLPDSTVPHSPCCLSWPRSHLTASKQTSHHPPRSPTALGLEGYSEQFSSVGNVIRTSEGTFFFPCILQHLLHPTRALYSLAWACFLPLYLFCFKITHKMADVSFSFFFYRYVNQKRKVKEGYCVRKQCWKTDNNGRGEG